MLIAQLLVGILLHQTCTYLGAGSLPPPNTVDLRVVDKTLASHDRKKVTNRLQGHTGLGRDLIRGQSLASSLSVEDLQNLLAGGELRSGSHVNILLWKLSLTRNGGFCPHIRDRVFLIVYSISFGKPR